MSPSAKYVQLDLNSPEFQQSWVELEAADAERVSGRFEEDFETHLAGRLKKTRGFIGKKFRAFSHQLVSMRSTHLG